LIERSRSANEIPLEDENEMLPRPLQASVPVKDQPRRRAESRGRPGDSLDHGLPRLSFIACALLIIGMPPLSGFIGKLSLLSALLNPLGLGSAGDEPVSNAAWGCWHC
jgi:multicomponent K+:H+ antiporter subunit D